jgi:hypothetical protein
VPGPCHKFIVNVDYKEKIHLSYHLGFEFSNTEQFFLRLRHVLSFLVCLRWIPL